VGLYRLYGLTVDCEFPLPALPAPTGTVDITVRWGELRPVPAGPPEGTVLSEFEMGTAWYFTVRGAEGYVVRYPTVCDAAVHPGLHRIDLHCVDETRKPLATALFAGSIMAKVMTLAGGCVLHASAVEADDRALAFVGPPGGGKTTVAALMCAAGARLLTDDVVRLVPRADGWYVPPGTGQLRLREGATSLAPALSGETEETVDGRIGVSPPLAGEVRLEAFVFPCPSRDASSVDVRRLSEEDVLMRLTRFPRVIGWKDPEILARSFRWNARLARELRAYEAVIPWGPPFRPEAAAELIRLLDADRSSA
jgi:hypothetical protein